MIERMRQEVLNWVKKHTDVTDDVNVTIDDIYVVWSVKVLQNWKALISTSLPDGMYYELTYNGDKDELYLDAYKKFDNVTIIINKDANISKTVSEIKTGDPSALFKIISQRIINNLSSL